MKLAPIASQLLAACTMLELNPPNQSENLSVSLLSLLPLLPQSFLSLLYLSQFLFYFLTWYVALPGVRMRRSWWMSAPPIPPSPTPHPFPPPPPPSTLMTGSNPGKLSPM
jgi:hypothetical protein